METKMVKEVLREHKSLFRKLDEAYGTVAKATKEETAEDRLLTLRLVIESYSKYHAFIGEMETHEMKEEEFIIPYIDKKVGEELKSQHIKIQEILEEGEKALKEFRNKQISVRELKEKFEKLYEEAKNLLRKHRAIEDRAFKKLLKKK